jgi:hypothetical protein
MRLSNNPATAALQEKARESRRLWIKSARGWLFGGRGTFASKDYVGDCIRHARRASRSSWQINKEPKA